jgi:hypothetical protein
MTRSKYAHHRALASAIPTTTATSTSAPSATPEAPTEPEVSATMDAGEIPTVKIHVHIRCIADEIEDLGSRLKALLGNSPSPRPEHKGAYPAW